MGYSKVDIANMALYHLGKETITALGGTSVEGRAAEFWYPKAVGTAKQASPWTFDREILTLASVDNDYSERWDYKYDFPSSASRLVRLIDTVDPIGPGHTPHVPFERIGGSIYTNLDSAKARIISNNTNPANWPDTFALAVSLLMASLMAPKLTRKGGLVQGLQAQYKTELDKAIEIDAASDPHTYAYESKYLRDRGGNSGDALDYEGADGSSYWS